MKLSLILALVAIVLCGYTAAKNHENVRRHSKNRSAMHLSKQNRAETCTQNCDGTNPMPGTKNWAIQLSIDVWLVYNADLNCIGIINKTLNMVIIIDGSGYKFIYNYNLGCGILTNIKLGYSVYIGGLAKFNFSVTTSIYSNFGLICGILAQQKVLVTGSFNITTGNYFDCVALLKYIMSNSDISGFFPNRLTLSNNLKAGFSVLISSLNTLFVNKTIDFSNWGYMCVCWPFLSGIGSLQTIMMNFFAAIAINLNGIFDSSLFEVLRIILKGSNVNVALSNLCLVLINIGIQFNTLAAAIASFNANIFPTVTNNLRVIGSYTYRVITSILGSNGCIMIKGTGTMTSQIIIIFNIIDKYVAFYTGQFLYMLTVNLSFQQCLYNTQLGVGLAITALNRGQSFTTNAAAIVGYFAANQYSLGCSSINTALKSVSINLLSQISVSALLQGNLSSNTLTTQFKGIIDAISSSGYQPLLGGLNVIVAMFKSINISVSMSTSFVTNFASFSGSISSYANAIVSWIFGG